jgi:hypothetical protein
MKLLYLMGAGHVGSTVMDVVIGAHPGIESLGEAWKLPLAWADPESDRVCACGTRIHGCAFWREARKLWAEQVGDDDVARFVALMRRYDGSGNALAWPRMLQSRLRPTAEFREYTRRSLALYEAVVRVGGKPVIVESSLSPRRAFVLASMPGIDLHLVHVVRDGRGVIWSHKNPAKAALRKSFEAKTTRHVTRYWLTANLQSAFVYAQLRPDRRMRLRYEDFATDPHAALARIGAFLGEDLSGLLTPERSIRQPAPPRHTPGGNRVRLLKEVQVRQDFGWMEQLPARDRAFFWRWAGWLASRYGYTREPSA